MKKLMVKVYLCALIILIVISLIICQTSSPQVVSAQEKLNEDIIDFERHLPTIEEDFKDNKVIVTLKRRFSAINKTINPRIFATTKINVLEKEDYDSNKWASIAEDEIIIKSIKDLTRLSNSDLLDNSVGFNQILSIELFGHRKQNVLNAITELEKLDFVLAAEPCYNHAVEDDLESPNDTYFTSQWGLSNTYGSKIQDAWTITQGNVFPKIKVGIFEQSVQSNHEDLRVIPGNFIPNDEAKSACHGTHVAGIIGAITNNRIGISGIAQVEVALLDRDSFVESLTWAIENGIKIVNASFFWVEFGTTDTPMGPNVSHANALRMFGENGGVFIASAGNSGNNTDNRPQYPSGYSDNRIFPDIKNVISVGSIDSKEKKSGFSCYGENSVQIYAPGEDILSTFPSSLCDEKACFRYGTHLENGYHLMDGTSMAAPHVTGTAALMLSTNSNLTGAQLKSLLINNSDSISISTPNGTQSVKKLNAYKAVKAARDYYQINALTSNTVELAGVNGDSCAEFNIPATLNGKTVVSIGANAFKNCVHLEKVILPESVTNIKSGAFSGCTKLNTVVIGNRNNIVTLGTNCFQNTANDLKLLVASDLYSDYRSSTGGQAYANKFVKTYLEGEKLYYEEITAVPGEGYVTCDAYFYLPDKDPILLDQNVGRIGFDRYYIMVSLCEVEYPLGAIDDCRLAIEVGSGEDCFILTNEGTIAGYCPYEDGYLYVPYMQLYQKGITEFYIFAMQEYAQLMTFYPSDVTIQLIHKVYL